MKEKYNCYHCGDLCIDNIIADGNHFCCNGCKHVYLLLSENGLCNYYQLNNTPGIKAKGKFTGERFAYLDDESVISKIVLFKSSNHINVTFSLPQIHCVSCIYLLEKLHLIESGIIQSRVDFQQKSIFISFNPQLISLRKVVELLSFIGYEPSISMLENSGAADKSTNKKQLIQIGVAGFCFSNIMMLSFPEYFSKGFIEQPGLQQTFSWIIFVLSIPVFLYSASSIFSNAINGLTQKKINIDVPISLAIFITFSRSYFEIFTHTGSGYLDSGTGIIFFMLIGRWFQNKSYDVLSFDRKYQSYFPLGITIKNNGIEENIPISKLAIDDFILVRNNDLIPADSILMEGVANIDYSFVNGENTLQKKNIGDLLYAGGKQFGTSILLKTIKVPSQSYITELWNNSIFNKNKETSESFIHPWSKYFTVVLLSIAFLATIYWQFTDSSKVLLVLTSVLIIACPCSLLLSATFTFGNMMRVIGKHHLFLKNATVIESLAKITHVVFDKTGTITTQEKPDIKYNGIPLSEIENDLIKLTASNSSHVLSRSLYHYLPLSPNNISTSIVEYSEEAGKGILAKTSDSVLRIGNSEFAVADLLNHAFKSAAVHVEINNNYKGYFDISHHYRDGLNKMVAQLNKKYVLHILSGDNDAEKQALENIFGNNTTIKFFVSPQGKLDYVKTLQQNGANVLMIGDGLNDAGALMQANVGIAVSENRANFSPASDAIIDGHALKMLPLFLKYARMGKVNISIGFAVSIIYNIIGIFLAIQGKILPVIAAILMPISSITIVLIAFLTSIWSEKLLKISFSKS